MRKTIAAGLVLALALLAGCAGQQSPSGSGTPAPPGSSSSGGQPPGRQSDSQAPAPGGNVLYEMTQNLPQAPYAPAKAEDIGPGTLDWYHFLEPEAGEGDMVMQPVLTIQFHKGGSGTVWLARGMFETGGGEWFIGEYSYIGNGVFRAVLGQADTVANADGDPEMVMLEPVFTVDIEMAWPVAPADTAVLRLTAEAPVDNEAFLEAFGPYMDEQMTYVTFN